MTDLQPSRTAVRVAVRRAAHQVLDVPPVFIDPLALTIAGVTADAIRAGEAEQAAAAAAYARLLRAFLAVRSRVAEDEVGAAVARGITQYVVLGAGFDTFAYRNPHPHLHVFEVDQPATQSAKQGRLAEAGIVVPPNVTFVPVDFSRQALATELERHGLVTGEGAVFSWLGVTPYLEREVVLGTLRAIATLARPGGGVVFDYGVPVTGLDPVRQAMFEALLDRLRAAGEPWVTFFEPDALARDLQEIGFGAVTDWGSEEINTRYFDGRADGLRVGALGHVVTARVS